MENLKQLKETFSGHSLLGETAHRPWALPTGSWQYYQEWNRALFLHWRVDPRVLRDFVPPAFELDLFQAEAYVTLVAFTMEKIRPRWLPAFTPISNFDEINIRTYVKFKEKPGVYFLSIEGSKRLSCQIAKSLSHLPYRYSSMGRSPNRYVSKSKDQIDQLTVTFEIGEAIPGKSALDYWLTERYALFQDKFNRIYSFEIHHLEWELCHLKINQLTIEYDRFNHLFQSTPLLCHYSPGVQVLAWGKQSYRGRIAPQV